MREERDDEEHTRAVDDVLMQFLGLRNRQTGWPDFVWIVDQIEFLLPYLERFARESRTAIARSRIIDGCPAIAFPRPSFLERHVAEVRRATEAETAELPNAAPGESRSPGLTAAITPSVTLSCHSVVSR